jgi:NAD(P)H-dependent flavin oxidoreductase YrpB (nitropropane dioxygenase family)
MKNSGHTGDVATSILIPKVVDLCRGHKSKLHGGPIYVVAAGGIYDGRGLAMSLWYVFYTFVSFYEAHVYCVYSLGASAVWVGTRFICAKEVLKFHLFLMIY